MTRTPWTWMAVGLLVLGTAAATFGVQPERRSRPDRNGLEPPRRVVDEPVSPEEARRRALERLDNRLEWTRRMKTRFVQGEARLLEARERIEAGENPDEIMRGLWRESSPDLRIRVHQHGRVPRGEAGPDQAREEEQFPAATPEQKYRINRVLEVIVPGLAEHLNGICETERERCEQEYSKLAFRMRDLIQDGIRDEAIFDLRLEEMRVSAEVVRVAKRLAWLERRLEELQRAGAAEEEVRKASEERAGQETLLGALVGEQFDIRGRIREEELNKLKREQERLQRRIDHVSAEIAEQREKRDQVVDEQVREAMEQARQGRQREGTGGDRPRRTREQGGGG